MKGNNKVQGKIFKQFIPIVITSNAPFHNLSITQLVTSKKATGFGLSTVSNPQDKHTKEQQLKNFTFKQVKRSHTFTTV